MILERLWGTPIVSSHDPGRLRPEGLSSRHLPPDSRIYRVGGKRFSSIQTPDSLHHPSDHTDVTVCSPHPKNDRLHVRVKDLPNKDEERLEDVETEEQDFEGVEDFTCLVGLRPVS